MPKIYLSPSTQDWNPYVTDDVTEEEQMNLLADALEPWLYANAIAFVRNTPEMTAATSIAEANRLGGFDFYLALHSNASPESRAGENRGILVFYYPTSTAGARAAEIFAKNLRSIYPLPNEVRAETTTSLGEVRRVRYPANLLELGYHDNAADVLWLQNNTQQIAQNLALSLTQYFELPLFYPHAPQQGIVATGGTPLRLRDYPGTDGRVLALMPRGAALTVYSSREGWVSVEYGGRLGYAAEAYIAT